MKSQFASERGIILVRAELSGPNGSAIVRLALDTGATDTLINFGILFALGYDPAVAPERRQITTASGVEFVPRILVKKFKAAGQVKSEFPVLAHTLPPSATVDGLLGLDFLRNRTLTINFNEGWFELS